MRLVLKVALPIGALASCVAIAQTDAARDRLAKHAEVFRTYAAPARSPRLEDLKPNSQGIIQPQRMEIRDYMAREPGLTETLELRRLASRTDAVIAGTTRDRYSAIDPTHTFLYSDWIVSVSTIYKNASTVQVGSEVTVARMGGDLTVGGRHMIDRDPSFPEFTLNHTYVFYLRALPGSSSFVAIAGWTFDVTGTTPILLADPRDPTGMRAFSSRPTASFLAEVERSVVQ